MRAYNGYMQTYNGEIPIIPSLSPTLPLPLFDPLEFYVLEVFFPPRKKILIIPYTS